MLSTLTKRFLSSGPNPATLSRVLTKTPSTPVEASPAMGFGKLFTDHMLNVDWNADSGFADPQIVPFEDLKLHPASSVLHYGLGVFEGMKVYLGPKGELRMFRPDRNMNRMHRSCVRLSLPGFDEVAMLDCIKELVKVDKSFVPSGDGYSLYVRPTAIGTHPNLGVAKPSRAKFFTILSPVGPYYPEGFKPITLWAETKYVRAFPGGIGEFKAAGNYAPTIYVADLAAQQGFTQILWLYGKDHQVSEVGTSNFFALWKTPDGRTELVTPPLDDGTILPGVTRESIIELTRNWGEFDVTERRFTMHELIEAINEGRVMEVFGSGTAAIVSPVKGIHFEDKTYEIPTDPEHGAGPVTRRILEELLDIQYGRVEHEWSVVIE